MPSLTGRRAGRLQFRHPGDDGLAVRVEHGLARGAVHLRRADFDQAHAAHAHRFQLGMVAKHRDVDSDLFRRVGHHGAGWHGNRFAVNRQVDCHITYPSSFGAKSANVRPLR